MKHLFLCLYSLPLVPTVSHAASTFIDFDVPTDLGGLFTRAGTAGAVDPTHVPTGGLGGSGGLSGSSLTDLYSYSLNQGFAGNVETWKVGMYLETSMSPELVIGASTVSAPAGVGGIPASPVNGAGTAFEDSVLFFTSTDGVGLYNRVGGTTASGELMTLTGQSGWAATEGWVYTELQVEYLGGNDFRATGKVYSSDDAGVVGAEIFSLQSDFTNAALASDPEVHAYFLMGDPNITVDGFSLETVPEPASGALAFLAGAGFLFWRKRG